MIYFKKSYLRKYKKFISFINLIYLNLKKNSHLKSNSGRNLETNNKNTKGKLS